MTLLPFRLSASTLNLFRDCPRCFWKQFNEGVKRPAGIFPSLPSGMDRVLKAHFDSFMGRGLLPPELKGLDGSVKLFDDKLKLFEWRDNFRGLKWADSSGNVLTGALDNVLVEAGGKLVVLDFKTRGFPLKENSHSYYEGQLDAYNFLLRKNGFQTVDYSYLLFYHPARVNTLGHVEFNTDLVKVAANPENAEKRFRKALECLQNPKPEAAENCEWCKWATRYQE